jgi:DNA-binding NarL/FixJ family response regulator
MVHPNTIHLLLFSNRPMIIACFTQLEHLSVGEFQVYGELLSSAEFDESRHHLARYTLVALDVAPDPLEAARVCRKLLTQQTERPLVGIVCCSNQLHFSHLQALTAVGMSSLLDLSLPLEFLAHAIQRIAHGSTIVHLDVHGERGSPVRLAQKLVRASTAGVTFYTDEENIHLLKCVACGLSDQEIANRLCLSSSTVHHRIERWCKETETRNRTELAAWAGRWGFYEAILPDGNGNVARIVGKIVGK